MSKYKEDIIRLRKNGKAYREIKDELGCAKSTVAYHCQKEGLEDIGMKIEKISDEKKEAIRETYKEETVEKTAEIHNVGKTTVKKYGEPKRKHPNPIQVDNFSLFENETENQVFHTNVSGHIGEQKVANEALKKGYTVSEPIIKTDYDLLIDNGEEIKRVQVKYSDHERNGSYTLSLESSCMWNGFQRTYNRNEIDAIIGYIDERDAFVLIPPKVFENRKKFTIRFDEAENSNQERINYYEDFAW